MNPEFDRDMAHAIVSRAIDQLKGAGAQLTPTQRNWLYRMGMVGIMAAYAAEGHTPPQVVRQAVVKGSPLSPKKWRDVLGEPQ